MTHLALNRGPQAGKWDYTETFTFCRVVYTAVFEDFAKNMNYTSTHFKAISIF